MTLRSFSKNPRANPGGPGHRSQSGLALIIVVVFTALALALVGAAITWSSTSTRLNARTANHGRAVAAAEAAAEKVLARIADDFEQGGLALVQSNLAGYRQTVPLAAESGYWANWQFSDAQGNSNRTYIDLGSNTTYAGVNSIYVGLKGFSTPCTVVSNARETNSLLDVVGGVRQEVQLTRIPVFQFAMFSSMDMEISCGQPFTISGRVHANQTLYIEPDSTLTILSDVTAVGDIVKGRHPLDSRSSPSGSVNFQARSDAHTASMNLPIGTNNTSDAIREIIHPPPSGESPSSDMGRQRYYNQVDMIVWVSNNTVQVTSGRFNNFSTTVPNAQTSLFISTNASFWDSREEKTVLPVEINVGALTQWSQTNTSLRAALGGRDISSVYVLDGRTPDSSYLGAVRLTNGRVLPSLGLTIATARPLYIHGHYNQPNDLYLGSATTWPTKPASIAADAITILSGDWADANSTSGSGSRKAAPTTVNAAFLTGNVPTTKDNYSGGMENFPRFMEKWGSSNPFAYNGSMVLMFSSAYATNRWGKSNVYDPPKRDWTYDENFNDPAKLPPLTPSLTKIIRSRWATVVPNSVTAVATPY